MSMEREVKVTCARCGAEGGFVAWESINAQLDSGVKEKLMSRELFTFTCPQCGAATTVVYDLLYHDMDARTMIQLLGDEEEIPHAVSFLETISKGEMMPGVQEMGTDYRLRIVRSQEELREKIGIFDQGLDDRIVELMKAVIGSELVRSQPEIQIQEIRLQFSPEGPEKFAVGMADGQWGEVEFPRQLYDDLRRDFPDFGEEGRRTYIIDAAWAFHQLEAGQ